MRIAVVLHVYFIDVAQALRAACAQVPAPCDILVTTDTKEKATTLREMFSEWAKGAVCVTVIPNRGRDMLSKVVSYRHDFNTCDVLLFLHSKRSLTRLSDCLPLQRNEQGIDG
jgi:lipopolysaccharide biosynthesis protein